MGEQTFEQGPKCPQLGSWWLIVLAVSLLLTSPALADQTQIPNYRKARELHWTHLYPHGGFTLYCGQEFEDRTDLNVEHIYPAS